MDLWPPHMYAWVSIPVYTHAHTHAHISTHHTHTRKVRDVWHIFVIPTLGRRKQKDLSGSLANQPHWITESQVPVREHISKNKVTSSWGRTPRTSIQSCNLHTNTYKMHVLHTMSSWVFGFSFLKPSVACKTVHIYFYVLPMLTHLRL